MNALNHNALTCSAVPIPPWERSLQTVEAQPYFNVSQASLVLEGIVFDRNNNLLFVDVATGRVFKLTPERQLSIVLKENSFGASGLAVHKDGRIFIASVGDMQRGSVRAIATDCLLGKLCCLTATKAVTLNRQAWRSAPGIASCLLSLTAGPNLVER